MPTQPIPAPCSTTTPPVLPVVLVLAFAYLYAQGLTVKDQSFGSGLAYVLPAVVAMGLAIVTAVMALLTPSHQGE